MWTTNCNNVKPIPLDIEQRKGHDRTKQEVDLQEVLPAFGSVQYWLIQEEYKK